MGYKYPSSDDDRYSYALGAADARINFFISTGSISSTDAIYVLYPENLEEQLNEAARESLELCLNINTATRDVTLPAVCALYRNDFFSSSDGASKHAGIDANILVLKECTKFLGKAQSENVSNLLAEAEKQRKPVVVKYRDFEFKSYISLSLQDRSQDVDFF